MNTIYIFQYLSLDVCMGAVASAYFAGRVLHIYRGKIFYTVIFLTVYGIYNIDHYFDVRRGTIFEDARRNFQKRYSRFLLTSSLMALGTAGMLAFNYFSSATIRTGLVISFFMLIYLILVFFKVRTIFKEPLVAAGYTTGIWAPQLSEGTGPPAVGVIVLMALFYVGTLLNLYGYSLVDFEIDRSMNLPSLSVLVSKTFALVCNCILLGTGIALAALGIRFGTPLTLIAICFMHLVLQFSLSILFIIKVDARIIRFSGELAYLIFFAPILLGIYADG